MEISPRKFHFGKVHFTQNVFFPLGNSRLRLGKTGSVTVAIDKTEKQNPL